MAKSTEEFEKYPKSSSSIFNRSLTLHSTEFVKKPSLERSGSIKIFYNSSFESVKGKVKKLCSLFESPKSPSPQLSPKSLDKPNSFWGFKTPSEELIVLPPGSEDRVVVYFTSLRGIRRTYEDCYAVRMILRGFRVSVDERDISMDSAYKKELQSVLGGEKIMGLPQVFVRGKYVGGADVVKQLHEVGQLGNMLKGLPVRPPGYVCEGCGDVRFVPCANCSGSRKVFDEDDELLKRCPECNENGLIRCPTCCS